MSDIRVEHQAGSYTIIFAPVATLEDRLQALAGNVLAVVDRRVHELYREQLASLMPQEAKQVLVDGGDAAKNLDSLQAIWDACAEHGIRRDGLLVAVGGGVVGDMVGFAAATWMRGIDFLQVPTTLLAQVDSSVGGKTGINHTAGKNLIGAFHQPVDVLIDLSFLDTLPRREFSAGMAEIIKAALLAGEDELKQVEALAPAIMAGDRDALEKVLRMSITLKARIVAADEREAGQRAVLNLGHTFGHAIERELGYGSLLHGEAVGLGLLAACRCSEAVSGLAPALRQRVGRLLETCQLPAVLPAASPVSEQLLDAMGLDKKALSSGLRLVLLESAGKPVVADDVASEHILAAWDTIQPTP